MKKRKFLVILLAISMLVSLTACSGNAEPTPPASGTESSKAAESVAEEPASTETSEEPVPAETPEESDPMVDIIDLTYEGEGNIKFDHVEKANSQLTDYSNALIFVFEYTNYQSKPVAVWSTFRLKFYQNGTELTENPSYSSAGGDQFDLVHNYMSEAMKNGKVTFGQIVVPKDNSPITIMVEKNGDSSYPYQMMEVDISSAASSSSSSKSSSSSSASETDIEAALQGQWKLGGENTFTFDNGSITIEGGGNRLDGTYSVNTSSSSIEASLDTTDGSVSIKLPYTYSNGKLTLKNNNGQELVKQ